MSSTTGSPFATIKTQLKSGRLGTTFAAALVAASCLLGASTNSAQAGAFTVIQCSSLGAGMESMHSFASQIGFDYLGTRCDSFTQSMQIAADRQFSVPSGARGEWWIGEPGIELSDLRWTANWTSADGWQANFLTGDANGVRTPMQMPIVGQNGVVGLLLHGPFSTWVEQLRCTMPSCPAGSPAQITAGELRATANDTSAPRIDQVRGSLYGDTLHRGVDELRVTASDVGSGVQRISVTVNGIEATAQTFACKTLLAGTLTAYLAPCPPSASADFTIDTERPPFHDGANLIRACVNDFSTNDTENVTCPDSSARTIRVDNSCPSSDVGGGSDLTARFRGLKTDVLTLRSPKHASIDGLLQTASGGALAAATICVRESILDADPVPAKIQTIKTDAAGRYLYRVDPGPNRLIAIAYRSGNEQTERSLTYLAHARPTLEFSKARLANGNTLNLTGHIPPPGNADRIVILQARVAGPSEWKTFQRARTRRHGAFHTKYRFNSTFTTTTYQMRAVLPRQNGYPFLGGASTPRKVKVTGAH